MKRAFRSVLVLLLAIGLPAAIWAHGQSETSAAKTAGPVTIELWGWVPTTTQWPKVYAEFQKEFPKIKIDYWRGEMTAYESKLQVAMAGGEGPDVLGLQPGLVTKYQDFLQNLAPYAKASDGSNWKNDLVSASLLREVSSQNGTVVALPSLVSGTEIVLYNKTLFDKAGITSVPKTLSEWVTDSNILKAHGIIPVATGLKDSWEDSDLFMELNAQVAPGSIYKAIDGKISFTSPEIVKTMELWKKVYNEHMFENGSLGISTYPDARDQYYYSTKAAMFLTGSWHLSYALPDGEKYQKGVAIAKDQTSAFMFPQCGPYPPRTVESVDTGFGVNKASKKKEAAWQFVNYMFKGQGEQIMVNHIQGFPAAKGITVASDVLSQFKPSDRLAYENALKWFSDPVGIRTIPYTAITNALSVAMQDVADGTQTPQGALQAVQNASESVTR